MLPARMYLLEERLLAVSQSAKLCFEGRAHGLALAAKEVVFLAQDELSNAWNYQSDVNRPTGKRAALLRKLERRLAKVRAELEKLDNDALAYRMAGGEL